MYADKLREAAKVLRERAEAATGATHHWQALHAGAGTGRVFCGQVLIAKTDERIGQTDHNAAYIATVAPPFALAVADWLGMAADHAAGRGDACGSCIEQALAVADAVLGGESE